MASAGSISSTAAFLSALNNIYGFSYLSSTSTATATTLLATGAISAAAYSTASTASSVASAVATINVGLLNAALYCTYLAAATNNSAITSTRSYSTQCVTSTPSLGQAPAAQPPSSDYTWVAPLVVCSVFAVACCVCCVVWVARRYRREKEEHEKERVTVVNETPWTGVALRPAVANSATRSQTATGLKYTLGRVQQPNGITVIMTMT